MEWAIEEVGWLWGKNWVVPWPGRVETWTGWCIIWWKFGCVSRTHTNALWKEVKHLLLLPFVFGAPNHVTWSIPSVCHSNGGGVVISAANEAITFTRVEGGVVCWDGVVGGRGGDEIECVVDARHDFCVED